MTHHTRPSMGRPLAARRRAVSRADNDWVQTEPLFPGKNSCLQITPAIDDIDLVGWGRRNASFIQEQLLEHGALLFRGFDVGAVETFQAFVDVTSSSGAQEYRLRAGPRRAISGNVYTSTDYPADQSIFPHNEGAFQPEFPLRLYFYCVTPAEKGGETPLGDNRHVSNRIPADIKRRFVDKGILYRRNFGGRFGLPWQTVFSTDNKQDVDAMCCKLGVQCEWKDEDWLRTQVVGPAIVKHPQTRERIWFNHATFFHISTLPSLIREGLRATFTEDDLPNNTYYGDGTPIEPEVLDRLRQIYGEEMAFFRWQPNDVLAVDNLLIVHARNPFKGKRLTTVAMADPITWADVAT